jgi:hypothetical protein
MTIIVAAKGQMVADSGETMGEIVQRVAFPKIVRNNQGWLAGCSGEAGDGDLFNRWFKDGMPIDRKPEIDNDKFAALLMSPGGDVYRIEDHLNRYRVNEPATCGEQTAEAFVLGAIAAGASLETAVSLACDWCVWVKGPVQVESV